MDGSSFLKTGFGGFNDRPASIGVLTHRAPIE
jgi:hypothetical protein